MGGVPISNDKWHEEVQKRIKCYLEDKGYHPRCSHDKEDKENKPLYSEYRKKNKVPVRFSYVDCVIPDKENKRIKYIIEIEKNDARPKVVIGDIVSTYLSRYYYRDDNEVILPIKDAILFVVVNPNKAPEGGSKKEQFVNIERELLHVLKCGSLCDFKICIGLEEFKEEFERVD